MVWPTGQNRLIVDPGTNRYENGLVLRCCIYRRETTPSWAPSGTLQDTIYELIVVAVKGPHVAVCASEAAIRDRIARKLTSAHPVSSELIERSFVGTNANAMWLSGIHIPTSVKATAKALLGPALEDALDPLGDQSYFYKAVRTTVPIDMAGVPRPTVIGASPEHGRIWLNRPGTWDVFVRELEAILDHIANPPQPQKGFRALAQRLNTLSGVKDAYEVAIVPTELLSEMDDTLRDMAQTWAYESTFKVKPGAGASLIATVWVQGKIIGEMELTITFGKKAIIAHQWISTPPAGADKRDEFADIVLGKGWLKIYYQDGYTIAGDQVYRNGWQDQPFDWEFVDLTGYAVKDEKPKPHSGKTLAECIGEAKKDGTIDNSLFGYVVRKAFPKGWLASDDGSMELADFIHIDPASETVTLIHAKGAKTNGVRRQVSVANYEVVVSQAIKNLRHLDRVILADALDSGSNKKIARAVWYDGKRIPDRKGIIAAARKLGSNYKRQVIVFQPQLTQKEQAACVGPKPTARGDRLIRMRQLDTLMLAARLSARSIGADLIGWGDGSP
ncbi:hypothetical protein VB618_11075 [Microvirga sp. CF3062]|uniref:hypothetical protein n=1 Tax=Microvirga sp. CF3062 TaxID=3110182 RepID=UPI002E77A6DF|nr:hypothetical protein [Microvirga sp. CF3062]MEE1656741.1 hypothetical protein [Microvirga sp. CF3062]